MIYTIGFWWALLYFVLALVGIIGGIIWTLKAISESDKPIGGIIVIVLGLGMGYMWWFAATHFNVPYNHRALVVDSVKQEIIGVRNAGVQPIPLIGVRTEQFPAYTFKTDMTMGNGIASATTSNKTSVYIAVSMQIDTRQLDLSKVYSTYNGNWNDFNANFLTPQLLRIARDITQGYTADELTTKRNDWQAAFETASRQFLSENDFGVTIITGQTSMTWDFVLEADAAAYDNANRASYLKVQREKEKEALAIEAEMATMRANMLNTSASGTVTSLQTFTNYMMTIPPELRPYITQYLDTQVDMEYLRLLAENKPDTYFPPNGGNVQPVYSVPGLPTETPVTPVAP